MYTSLLSQKVLFEDLVGKQSEKDAYIAEKFGLDQADMNQIHTIREDAQNRFHIIFDATHFLKDRLSTKKELNLGSQFTINTITALVADDWDSPSSQRKMTSKSINQHYHKKINQLEDVIGDRIPGVHFLRDEIGVYAGNLIQKRLELPLLEFSNQDLSDSIRIPDHTDEGYSLLGTLVGYSAQYMHSTKNALSLYLYGRAGDEEFFSDTIIRQIKEVFNKTVKICQYRNKSPLITLGSKAIISYLNKYMGFPICRKEFNIVDFDGISGIPNDHKKLKIAYFSGLISTGNIVNGELSVDAPDPGKEKLYLRLCEEVGFRPTYNPKYEGVKHATPSAKAIFSVAQTRTLEYEGYILNPRLRQAI
jgi:hypothetical protein